MNEKTDLVAAEMLNIQAKRRADMAGGLAKVDKEAARDLLDRAWKDKMKAEELKKKSEK